MTIHTHRKGSAWRHKVEQWFIDAGFVTTVRGIGFAGDDLYVMRPPQQILGGAWEPRLALSVEAKNHKTLDLAGFVDQAVSQAHDYEEITLPVVIAHRRARASVDDAYVVMPGWAFIELVTR